MMDHQQPGEDRRRLFSRFSVTWLVIFVGVISIAYTIYGGKLQTTQNDSGAEPFASFAMRFKEPLDWLLPDQERAFFSSQHVFNVTWTASRGDLSQPFDGLGPLFSEASCSDCHVRNGRSDAPHDGRVINGATVFVARQFDGEALRAHSKFGARLDYQSTYGSSPEGKPYIQLVSEQLEIQPADKITLTRPKVLLSAPHGEFTANSQFNIRIAPPVYGLGLLEAVDEEIIVSQSDPDDLDGDGISGKLRYINFADEVRIGRFGWKSGHHSLESQISSALLGEMGIMSELAAANLAQSPESVEISATVFRRIVDYVRMLAPPSINEMPHDKLQQGNSLFQNIGCIACHRASYSITPPFHAAAQSIEINPYTDLLLHDMGAELSENGQPEDPLLREWRTAPLWGIGLTQKVNSNSGFMHDGRAQSLEEAILWHGGEASESRRAFLELDDAEKRALLEFLRSL